MPRPRRKYLAEVEVHIIWWLAQGLSSKEVARKVSLSPNTVLTHIKIARSILHAKTACHAVYLLKNSGAFAPFEVGNETME